MGKKRAFIFSCLVFLEIVFVVSLVSNSVFGQEEQCLDGTKVNSCSVNKPEYCNEKAELTNNCDKCGCPNLLDCVQNQCKKEIIPPPNYDCTFCHGVCYSKDTIRESICTEDDRYFEWEKGDPYTGIFCKTDSDCDSAGTGWTCIQNHCLYDLYNRPWGLPIEIKTSYPRSIPKDESFKFKVTVKNLDSKPIAIRIFDVYAIPFFYLNNYVRKLSFDDTKLIPANSEQDFLIDISFPVISSSAEIQFLLSSDRDVSQMKGGDYFIIFDTFNNGFISVYDLDFPVRECGNIKYNQDNGVCINDILYPTYPHKACKSNDDCSGMAVCLNYNCEMPFSRVSNFDQLHNVGIVSFVVYNDKTWFDNSAEENIDKIKKIADETTDWFQQERIYQKAENNFNINYNFVKRCAFSVQEYINILKSCPNNDWGECERILLNKCGIDESQYELLANTYFYEPNIDTSEIILEEQRIGVVFARGINFGNVLVFNSNDSPVFTLIHETLHSFGETDLYSNSHFNIDFQEKDCFLYKSQWDLFMKFPHLCDFEAKMIGWKDSGKFIRGNANSDGKVDLSDTIFILNYLFQGGDTPACLKAADANDDGKVDLTDAVYILNYLFLGNIESLPAPFPTAGYDTTEDGLTCLN